MTAPTVEFDGRFSEPDATAVPLEGTAYVFGVRPAKILAFGKSPYSQTRDRL
jgi:hypothetical protein